MIWRRRAHVATILGMTQAKDELFCRLALRQGLLSKEDATALLKHYRSEAKAGEGVGAFAVRNEYMDRGTASTIEGAINRRADGHVAGVDPA